MKKKITLLGIAICLSSIVLAQKVDYSVVSVNEESELNLTQITSDNDGVCLPVVKRNSQGVNWLTNRILDISKDGSNIAFVASRNNTTNIYIKDLSKQVSSIQRTNRSSVLDFCYSPDGKSIVFSEAVGETNQIFQTDATKGYVCRQITNGNKDYSPIFTTDMSQIFFARQEKNNTSIWSFDVNNKYISNYSSGCNPYPLTDGKSLLCTRSNAEGRSEIWRVDWTTGTEECIVSDSKKSFSTPTISPNGIWILMVGTGSIPIYEENKNDGSFERKIKSYYHNTDLYICRTDGSDLTQLTFHAADDLSPVWSKDGKYIYFISQRGSSTGTANIWRMKFLY